MSMVRNRLSLGIRFRIRNKLRAFRMRLDRLRLSIGQKRHGNRSSTLAARRGCDCGGRSCWGSVSTTSIGGSIGRRRRRCILGCCLY